MSQDNSELRELLKKFLIVGETLDMLISYSEFNKKNILIAVILTLSSIFSISQFIDSGSFWLLLSIFFFIVALYYSINARITAIYALTKFRIFRLERNIYANITNRRNELVGFSDLHFEHVESINIGKLQSNIVLIYLSLFGVSTGWLILETIDKADFRSSTFNFLRLMAYLIIIASVFNIAIQLPITGIQMTIQSISGNKFSFPEKKLPKEFISQLMINCRSFLSYGAE